MSNVSTPLRTSGSSATRSVGRAKEYQPGPRKTTIAMLRQFARAYTCVPALPVALGSFVAN